MSIYLKKFETHNEYETYIASEGKILPNVSFCKDDMDVHYNPYVGTPKVELKYYVSSDDLGNDIKIFHMAYSVPFETMEVDGVLLDSVESTYRFDTEGIHTVKLTLPEGGTVLKGFYGCSNLIEVKIPNIITSIGEDAFSGCYSLVSITIPESVTNIEYYAFYGCYELTSAIIPNSMTNIGHDAFFNCQGLTFITINATTPPTLGGDAFGDTNNCPINVPSESVETYKSAESWSVYANRIQAIS